MSRVLPADEASTVKSEAARWLSFDNRVVLVVAALVITVGLIIVDFITWIQLDVVAIFGIPLVLAGATRSRGLLWSLAASITITTFVVYALQIPPGAFALHEPFFVNRMLDVASLLLIAMLLHIWIASADTSDAQARLISDQNEKLVAARVSRRLVEVLESERRGLANGLHDLVGQKLTALSINLNIVKAELALSTTPRTMARLEDSLNLVEETIECIRDVMTQLRPAVLDDYGLPPVLRWYAEQFTKRNGVATTVVGHGPDPRLPPAVEEALFRIVQEALANVAKYARAQRVTVTLEYTTDVVRLTVADDGCGFDPTAPHQPVSGHGWGLMIMRERAAEVGARLVVDSAPGRGTRVVVTLTGVAQPD
ncbi:MAG: sensor histidine kinase [Betaproteobacteria bacterium]